VIKGEAYPWHAPVALPLHITEKLVSPRSRYRQNEALDFRGAIALAMAKDGEPELALKLAPDAPFGSWIIEIA
jgi:hypothetical protein